MFKLIDVSSLERRVQTLENKLSITVKLNEIQEIRMDAQLGRILELEVRVNQLQDATRPLSKRS